MSIVVEGNGGYSEDSAKCGEIQVSKVRITNRYQKVIKSMGPFLMGAQSIEWM